MDQQNPGPRISPNPRPKLPRVVSLDPFSLYDALCQDAESGLSLTRKVSEIRAKAASAALTRKGTTLPQASQAAPNAALAGSASAPTTKPKIPYARPRERG